MNKFSHSFCYRTESDVHVAKKFLNSLIRLKKFDII